MNRYLSIIILTLCPVLCLAQYSDKELFRAYLHSDMPVWQHYLRTTNWSQLSLEQKLRYLNYEYGYVATAIDEKQSDAKQQVETFGAHIDELEPHLSAAKVLTYRSSYAAYRAKLSAWEFASQGIKAMNLAKQAVQADSQEPLALTLLGCVDFYAPTLFGGSKKDALTEFQSAYDIYRQRGDTVYNWNYASVCMQLAMCLDKTDHTAQAITLCEYMLHRWPDFTFIRDTYLPELRKKQKK